MGKQSLHFGTSLWNEWIVRKIEAAQVNLCRFSHESRFTSWFQASQIDLTEKSVKRNQKRQIAMLLNFLMKPLLRRAAARPGFMVENIHAGNSFVKGFLKKSLIR